jgi:hypothetical protein
VALSTDSAATTGVRTSVSVISWLKTFATISIGLAAIVTPFGLYERIAPGKAPTLEAFHYVQDKSAFGYGTPLQANLSWSRLCGALGLHACPNSSNNITKVFENATGEYWHSESDWYDTHVPQHVIDLFESGLSTLNRSVSSIFDIQWRSYTWSEINDNPDPLPIDNGTAYPVGSFRQISSLILNNAVLLVEGLIVDMVNGGIGFRNHSAPRLQPYGSTWTEDILFIQPETQCVDTNLTLDFSIRKTTAGGGSPIFKLVLTDRGGFANINQTYPTWDRSDTQNNPELLQRAYKAAWINNAWSMVFMNVTNPRNNSSPPFRYLNSAVGKMFPLHYDDLWDPIPSLRLYPDALSVSSLYGYYLSGTDVGVPGSNGSQFNISISGQNSSYTSKPPLYQNPFKINYENFSLAGKSSYLWVSLAYRHCNNAILQEFCVREQAGGTMQTSPISLHDADWCMEHRNVRTVANP